MPDTASRRGFHDSAASVRSPLGQPMDNQVALRFVDKHRFYESIVERLYPAFNAFRLEPRVLLIIYPLVFLDVKVHQPLFPVAAFSRVSVGALVKGPRPAVFKIKLQGREVFRMLEAFLFLLSNDGYFNVVFGLSMQEVLRSNARVPECIVGQRFNFARVAKSVDSAPG